MTENVSLQAEIRNTRGKTHAKKQRKTGIVPGVYYDREGQNIPVNLGYGALQAAYERAQNQVIYLQIKDEAGKQTAKPSLIWDIQFHPVKGLIQHVDFLGVDLSREMKLEIPVEFVGEPESLEREGSLTVYRESIPVACLPGNIPEKIEIDISELDIGDYVYLSQVTLPEGVTWDTDEDLWILGISAAQPSQAEEEESSSEESE